MRYPSAGSPYCFEDIGQSFTVQNLYSTVVNKKSDGSKKKLKNWNIKGKITEDFVHIYSIKWTGNYYFNLKRFETRPRLKITIATIEPFLIWRESNDGRTCDFGTVCYPYWQSGTDYATKRFDDIILNFTVAERDVKCCDGLEVELIEK